MKDDELGRALRGTKVAADPGHRDALEKELMEAYDAREHTPARRRRTPTWRQLSVAAALVAIVSATQVPAEYQVEVGKRITLLLPAGTPPRPLSESFGDALIAEGGRLVDLTVHARRGPEGRALVTIDVWGDRLVDDETAARRIRAMPSFERAELRVEHHTGRVRDNLLGKLGYALFERGASAEEREAARQQVIAHLREVAGDDADIDVQVEEEGGKQRIRARVQKRVEEDVPAP